jgi:hypothetical protein
MDEYACARTIFDLVNEPEAHGLAWLPQGGLPGVGDLYLYAMDVIHAVSPSAVPLAILFHRNCHMLHRSLARFHGNHCMLNINLASIGIWPGTLCTSLACLHLLLLRVWQTASFCRSLLIVSC